MKTNTEEWSFLKKFKGNYKVKTKVYKKFVIVTNI